MTTSLTTPDAFMAAAPAPLNGSSPWAQRYAAELRRVVVDHAERAPRSLQVHLGPSELGVACDRQVVGKLAGLPKTNHVSDPWPSIVGTAIHAWLADAFTADNARKGVLRWVAEQRVVPHPEHSGTADLYDAAEQRVVDHKATGVTTLAKIRAGRIPRHYLVQLLLYAHGYRQLGLPVRGVALAAWPRTASTLDGLYVWERPHTEADDQLITEVLQQTETRKAMAQLLISGLVRFDQIPHSPDNDSCFWCPFFRPEAARDGGPGCAGTSVRTNPNNALEGSNQP